MEAGWSATGPEGAGASRTRSGNTEPPPHPPTPSPSRGRGATFRVDTGVEPGGEVSQFYDPMIAKLIVHADTREEAVEALAEACAGVEVWPVKTNAGFLVRCLEHPRFVSGDVDTGFIAAEEPALLYRKSDVPAIAATVSVADRLNIDDDNVATNDTYAPWDAYPSRILGFRLNADPNAVIAARLNGQRVESRLQSARAGDQSWHVRHAGRDTTARPTSNWIEVGEDDQVSMAPWQLGGGEFSVIFHKGDAYEVRRHRYQAGGGSGPASDGALRAPMPGKIVATPAKPGDAVTKGQPIVVLEAMKMEHALVAPFDGVVGEIGVSVGDQVSADMVLAVVTAAE
ncbi:MAG: biotin/lipoyl-containing protein [Brevundimonas sp.]|nr:biotin/lipoyl-containing protein [Brevundimonas sp.]MDP3657663.1 biotin/lipoyl-containing protein [Brevundimonas sp.]